MKKMKSLALICAAALAALTFVRCGEDPTPEPEPEPDPKPVITITAQPQNITVTEGAITGNLTVAASVTEGATLSYQWYSNTSLSSTGGTAVGGATSSTFPIPTTLTAGDHYYFCEVSATGDAVSVRSNAATVTVSVKPVPVITISGQPQSVTVTEGAITGSLTVEATVTLDATLTYQWYTNTTVSNEGGTEIDGATAKSLAIPTDLAVGDHHYYVVVSAEEASDVRSNPATVTVSAKPVPVITIGTQPTAPTGLKEGSIPADTRLTVAATVTEGATLTYQWYTNTTATTEGGTAITGATAASYTLPTDLKGGSHFYFVEVKAEGATSVRSNVVTVEVAALPQATVRYRTIPYDPADFPQAQAFAGGAPFRAGAGTRAAGDDETVLVYSTRDARNNYYIYYGGRIELVPLLYQQAIYYNGITPITVGYSKSESVETSVSRSLEKATSESVETTSTLGLTIGVSASVGFGGNGVEVSTEISTSISEALGRTVSTSSTTTTTEGLVAGEEFHTEATIGTNNEPVGMYRYALFSTTDVYYNITFDRTTKKIVKLTVSLCARPVTYWGIDYEPELSGENSFGKTAASEMLQIPDFDLNNMPHVDIVPSPGTEVRFGDIIWAGANVGTTPRTFAPDASRGGTAAYGGLYQYNSAVAWPRTGVVSEFDSSLRSHRSWDWLNDPCPAGWRVPTSAEWKALIDAVTGGYPLGHGQTFTAGNGGLWRLDMTNPARQVFLPGVSWRNNSNTWGTHGDIAQTGYWSSTAAEQYAHNLMSYPLSDPLSVHYTWCLVAPQGVQQQVAMAIRCVRPAED